MKANYDLNNYLDRRGSKFVTVWPLRWFRFSILKREKESN